MESHRSAPEVSTAPELTGRRRVAIWGMFVALAVAWLAFGGAFGSYAGKLSEVQENNSENFLPKGAESARANELATQFTENQSFPAFLLLEGEQRLTPAQLQAMAGFAQQIPDLQIPVAGHEPVRIGDFLLPGEVPVVPSQDGRAALALINFDADRVGGNLADGESPILGAVQAVRAADDALATGGVSTYVAGPAATIADLVEAFGGIDGVLLGVALGAVAVILLIVYRSPVVPIFVLLTSVFALTLASTVVYFLAENDALTLDGQGQGILSILVIGAATDYSLLMVARYREELRRHDDRFAAMALAWRRSWEPIAASGATVILGLLCLLLADLGPTRGLGPVGAVGIAASMLSALTFLPAVLVIFGRRSAGEHGRWVFWPRIPHVGSQGSETVGIWARVATFVGRHPRRVWIITVLVLAGLAAFLPTLKATGVSQDDTFLTRVESVTGDEVLAEHFPAGSGNPTVVIGPQADAQAMLQAAQNTEGVSSASLTPLPSPGGPARPAGPKVVDGRVQIEATLTDSPTSPAAYATVDRLREGLHRVAPDAVVGGGTAINRDVLSTSENDRNRIIPVILLVIFVVLSLLLRSLLAPLLLVVANVLSFAATMGMAALVFNHLFDFPGADPAIPLYGFVFLVALGIDYSIFLMSRVREESQLQGTRAGILTGLAVTGGVITSAGLVLAATFAALGVLPLLFLVQTAFVVAFGVLLDTFVVRSLLVPALGYDIGSRIWWPSRLSRVPDHHGAHAADPTP